MLPSEQTRSAEAPTAETFIRSVLRSGLLDNVQLRKLLDGLPAELRNDAQALSNHLVKTGQLTRFQAGKLLQGITLGLVLGPFHILAPLGKGGMGAVYLARDSRNQNLVAIKVLPPKLAKASERLLARFRREMEVNQRVNHPHLTRTLEAGTHLDVNYIAMEYIPGKNLYKLVREEGPFKVPRAARLFAEVCLGLESAHGMGLIHRDLKPSNIMITPDDHAKVLDLGLALIQGEVGAERTITSGQSYVVGTLDYLAPEQAEDALKVDARSDIYSLGCTLYFCLTGKPPFPGGNALQKILRHRCDPPQPVNELNPAVPPRFAALLTKMMAKRPELRYASAAELRQALLPWAEAEPKPDVVQMPVEESSATPWWQDAEVPPAALAVPSPASVPVAQLLPADTPLKDVPAALPVSSASAPVAILLPETVPSRNNVRSVPAAAPSAPANAPPAASAAAPSAPAGTPSIVAPSPAATPAAAPVAAPAPVSSPPLLVPSADKPPEPGKAIEKKPDVPVPVLLESGQPSVGTTVPVTSTADELPFWLDFGLPVGGSVLFLAILWTISMIILWRQ